MSEKYYSVGELAKLAGTTVRTIQYYDKIELLVAKRSKNKNLRYYPQNDLLTLQQILFYKKLGIPLMEIKSHLMNYRDKNDIKNILTKQADILFQKEMEAKMNIAIIEAIIATIDADPTYDLEEMMKLALNLNKDTILTYASIQFNEEATRLFEEKYQDDNEVIEFYWKLKQLLLEAVSYKTNNVPYKSDTGYQFGKKWTEFIDNATGNDPEMIKAFTNGLEQSEQWPEEDLFLYNFCSDFIDNAYDYYSEKKGGNQDDSIN